MNAEAPSCCSGDGHAWVSGGAELNDEGMLVITSRQCRHCGWIEEVEDDK